MRAVFVWLWNFIGKWLVRPLLYLALLAAIALGLGWAYYQVKFSGPVSAQEEIPPGEAEQTQAIIEDAIRVVEQHRENTRVLRDAHAKAHGCVKAEVTVDTHIPADLQKAYSPSRARCGTPGCASPTATPTPSKTAKKTPAAWPSSSTTCPAPS